MLKDRPTLSLIRGGNRPLRAEALEKRARWMVRGKRYLRSSKIKFDNAAFIQVDPKLADKIAKLIEQLTPEVARQFEEQLYPVAKRAVDLWPIDTGLSHSMLSYTYHVAPGGLSFTARFTSGAPYTLFIKSAKQGERGNRSSVNPWQRYVRKPFKNAAHKVALKLAS